MSATSKINSRPQTSNSPLTSKGNRWLKRFRGALGGEESDDGLVAVEGIRMVEAALGSGLHVEAVLVSASGEHKLERLDRSPSSSLLRGVRILRTSDRLFAGLADTHSPQGVAALVRPKISGIDDVVRGVALVVVLVGIQDPGNVGTILRAAEAFGATGAAVCGADAIGTANPFGPKALRASAGSALRLPIMRGMSSAELFLQLRSVGVKLYAAVTDSAARGMRVLKPWEADWKSPAALLIGNEGAGLPEEMIQESDALVSIPKAIPQAIPQGILPTAARTAVGIESLNAAMAGSVLLYEAMRQRGTRANI